MVYMCIQVHPEGKFVVDLDKNIDMKDVQPNCRVALRKDSYRLHKILPNKVRKGGRWEAGREGGRMEGGGEGGKEKEWREGGRE